MCQYVIDCAALQRNIQVILQKAGEIPVWAVLKGDGYGLGIREMAGLLYANGVNRFCVSEIREARELRSFGLGDAKILCLQPTADRKQVEQLLELNVIFTISSWEDARILSHIAEKMAVTAHAHLKIDTGMGRYGFRPDEMEKILSVYRTLKHISIEGIYTHFSNAGNSYRTTRKQFDLFRDVIVQIAEAGYPAGEAHCCNSAAFLKWPEMHMGGVRIGSAWLGRMAYLRSYGLEKVGFCESQVSELHWLKKGMTSGYGNTWKAKRDSCLAMIPVGWYHGFTIEYNRDMFRLRDCIRGCLGWIRAWCTGRRIQVKINGIDCPVCGHVGMLYTAVDVTETVCCIGDRAIFDISPLEKKGMKTVFRDSDARAHSFVVPHAG